MRLICPNCDAQYEVDASLIPDSGRDVQCADCGHVWFQVPENAILPGSEDEADAAALLGQAVAPPDLGPEPEPDTPAPPAAKAEPEAPTLPRVQIDESLLAVLREEADREIRARAEETARAAARGLETQPDLGLEDPPALRIRPRAAPAAAPVSADMDADPDDGTDPDHTRTDNTGTGDRAAAVARSRPARRELLPDIDRINSTLDASGGSRKGGMAHSLPAKDGGRRQGFRAGFLSVLAVAALGWMVYDQSARISATLPGMAPLVDSYVGVVDGARIGLDRLVRDLLATLNG